MAKQPLSARVPDEVSEGVEEYAETWDLTRTEAIERLLRFALEDPPAAWDMNEDPDVNPSRGVYTIELGDEAAESLEEVDDDPSVVIERLLNIYS
jgi:hypothetical protein